MTLQGSIEELNEMREDTSLPVYYALSLADVINTLQTDVQEVKHGRWVMDENPHDGDCRCSVCTIAIDQMHERNHGLLNALTGGKWWTFYRYCPNCGSRMDLEGEEE